ncbi:MAG TPA: MerR family DNA-binding protein [Vicinamibacteria bacterium]|jgi:MerR family copper efflux transcriptional regulator|nr:MerR family DNA-binding protein [Vicinamibacteria bacterium]
MRIGDLAATAGVSVQAVRYYELHGLIERAPRRPSGYRDFPSRAAEQLRMLKWAQTLGFSLKEIRALLAIPVLHGQGRTAEARARAAAKIAEVDGRIRRLREMRKRLKTIVKCDCNGDCPILRTVRMGTAR